MNRIKNYLTRLIPDKMYLKLLFKHRLGYVLNFKDPETFNEKLNWLKIYDRNPIYCKMVDKYEAKKYVANIIGDKYIIKNYGVWKDFDEIDFNSLPNQFVLKCTHDSGGLVICRDKSEFDYNNAKKKISYSLKRNYYYGCREWPYKNIKPRIIAEMYMEEESKQELIDYKFYCFNGEPRFLYISKGLDDHSTASISFVNLDWTFAPYQRSDFKPFHELPSKPKMFDQMIELSKKLSKSIPFLRVDLYEINNEVYFSELTFSPCGGFMPFISHLHDIEIGELLKLPLKKN